jgi:hypothetical protein
MALPSGVYTIENVYNRNWAILGNDNDDEDVISGTDNSSQLWEMIPDDETPGVQSPGTARQ